MNWILTIAYMCVAVMMCQFLVAKEQYKVPVSVQIQEQQHMQKQRDCQDFNIYKKPSEVKEVVTYVLLKMSEIEKLNSSFDADDDLYQIHIREGKTQAYEELLLYLN